MLMSHKCSNYIGYFAILTCLLSGLATPANSQEDWVKEYKGLTYRVTSCVRKPQKNVLCNFAISAISKAEVVDISSHNDNLNKSTRIIDPEGNEYFGNKLTIGNKSWEMKHLNISLNITPGIQYKASINFTGVPELVSQIAAFQIWHTGWSYDRNYSEFKNIPILNSSYKPSSRNLSSDSSTLYQDGLAIPNKSCKITDSTGTPLNIRDNPSGNIIGQLDNERGIYVLEIANDKRNRPWAKIAEYDEGQYKTWG
jgi:hypothetical protein